MKTTTKFLAAAVAAVALFTTTTVKAQKVDNPHKFGIGLNAGYATSDGFGLALGGDLRYQFDIDKQLSVPITAGYTRIFGKEIDNTGIDIPDASYIPVKAGLKIFFNNTGSGAYGLGEVGAGFGVGNSTGTSFVYSPAIGYAWSNGLDLAAKYEGLTRDGNNGGYAGIRLAYGFKL